MEAIGFAPASDWGMLPRAVVDPPSLNVSKSGLGARLKETKLLGLVLGCAWLNISGQEVNERDLLVLPVPPCAKWG